MTAPVWIFFLMAILKLPTISRPVTGVSLMSCDRPHAAAIVSLEQSLGRRTAADESSSGAAV